MYFFLGLCFDGWLSVLAVYCSCELHLENVEMGVVSFLIFGFDFEVRAQPSYTYSKLPKWMGIEMRGRKGRGAEVAFMLGRPKGGCRVREPDRASKNLTQEVSGSSSEIQGPIQDRQ